MRRGLATAAAVGLVLLLGAGGLCRYAVNCQLRQGDADPFSGLAGAGAGEATLPPGFAREVVAAGFELPTSFAFLPDGRILVAEKEGRIRVVRQGRVLPRPLVDLAPRVGDHVYRGLLAIEPGPDFARTGHLYVLYVQKPRGGPKFPTSVRVSRLEVEGDRAARDGEQVILGTTGRGLSCNHQPAGADCIPCDGDHCGGDIAFAADGTMWVSTGDGWNGSPGASPNPLRAQSLDRLAGKVLRVTRDGRGLASNPYFEGDPEANRAKVWAYGVRNPFRLALRRDTGTPVLGNVGWATWEEIEVPRRGANLGWPCYEGPERPEEYAQRPVCRALYARGRGAVQFAPIRYRHGSITGGAFAGDAYPARWRGVYVYGDWSRSWLRWARFGANGEVVEESSGAFARNAAGPVEIRTGPDGLLYYLAANVGELRRLAYEPPE